MHGKYIGLLTMIMLLHNALLILYVSSVNVLVPTDAISSVDQLFWNTI